MRTSGRRLRSLRIDFLGPRQASQIQTRGSVFAIEFERAREGLARASPLALMKVGETEMIPDLGRMGNQLGGALQLREGPRAVALPEGLAARGVMPRSLKNQRGTRQASSGAQQDRQGETEPKRDPDAAGIMSTPGIMSAAAVASAAGALHGSTLKRSVVAGRHAIPVSIRGAGLSIASLGLHDNKLGRVDSEGGFFPTRTEHRSLERDALRPGRAPRSTCRFEANQRTPPRHVILWAGRTDRIETRSRRRASTAEASRGTMKILVTGSAGFIGAAVAERLLERGDEVAGVDSLNDYYDVSLKRARLERLLGHTSYRHHEFDLADQNATASLFESENPQRVVHLAAQAGVRYSIDHPHAYGSANLSAFLNVLEGCRHHRSEHLTYASSSSVYGGNTKTPFSERDAVDHPVSLYAATKRANELMAHTYSHLYSLPTTGLRFFTVYGPWGRPDMSPFLFVKRILSGEPIDVFNHGDHQPDFTYIDDIVEGVVRTSDRPASPDPDYDPNRPDTSRSSAPWRIFNIGCERPIQLMHYIEVIEECTGRKAIKNMLPMQPGDVKATYADVSALVEAVGYRPKIELEEGMARFVHWYREFYRV